MKISYLNRYRYIPFILVFAFSLNSCSALCDYCDYEIVDEETLEDIEKQDDSSGKENTKKQRSTSSTNNKNNNFDNQQEAKNDVILGSSDSPQLQGTAGNSNPQLQGTSGNSTPETQTNNDNFESQQGGGTLNAGTTTSNPDDSSYVIIVDSNEQDTGTSNSTEQNTGVSNTISNTNGNTYQRNTTYFDDINLFLLTLLFLFVSLYLLQISAENWLNFKQFKANSFNESRINYLNEQIEKINKLYDLRVDNSDEKRSLEYELRRYKDERDGLDKELYKFQDYSDNLFYNSNLIHYLIGVFCLMGYFNIYEKAFGIIYILDLLSIFIFPILAIASYYSIISLFRFTLSQGSYQDSNRNKYSLFGIIISLLTVTAAVITIFKYLFEN